ncbi:hypothetical protein [Streptomyces cellulosae]|uniref:hypothetical protein n=1 Tax=Streptomyces cellulosae TaxID=1968 RepID=UPI0004C8628D|nr:hypothetical protein [Streptomyces cellulosae]
MTTTAEQPWVKQHELHVFKQTEQSIDASGWRLINGTGLLHALCNCGYSTGWIPRDQMPSREQLTADHGEPFRSILS